ncbi:DNA methylase [archaeon]|nr:DNA methylase [archaeon]|tara:strand:+ start:1391 stop:2017 length:627 start_codon:yes stop_codon:yes gene_type:complete
MVKSKKQLAVFLSKLKSFTNPNIKLEQYATPSEIAAEWIWEMALKNEVEGKTFADFACGPGILGIGLLVMGAKKVHFLDCDSKILEVCKENYYSLAEEYEIGEAEFYHCDVSEFNNKEKIDAVVQNPPFGTKEKHVDKKFLEMAFKITNVVYSMHKTTTKSFVEAISKDFGFEITHHYYYKFPLAKTMSHHKKRFEYVDVDLFRMEKK